MAHDTSYPAETATLTMKDLFRVFMRQQVVTKKKRGYDLTYETVLCDNFYPLLGEGTPARIIEDILDDEQEKDIASCLSCLLEELDTYRGVVKKSLQDFRATMEAYEIFDEDRCGDGKEEPRRFRSTRMDQVAPE